MPRGRHYYDPQIQANAFVPSVDDLARIELYQEPDGRWCSRRIASDGSISEIARGSYEHEGALDEAKSLWPGLTVYELRSGDDDSTWEGIGPSPRMWAAAASQASLAPVRDNTPEEMPVEYVPHEEGEPEWPQVPVLIIDSPGAYIPLDAAVIQLRWTADRYDEQQNPSAAMALRAVAEAWGQER